MLKSLEKLTVQNKIVHKLLIVMIIIAMTLGNFVLLAIATGKGIASYAAGSIEGQTNKTQHKDVEFDAYFENEIGKEHSAVRNVEETAYIKMFLKIKGQGYLKNAQILMQDTNYRINALLEESDIIGGINSNAITLKQIGFGRETILDVPVEFEINENIQKENLNKLSKVTLEGTYVTPEGKEVSISKEIQINLGWEATQEIQIENKTNKYITYNKGILVQDKITISKEKPTLPISETEIKITAPNFEGVKPTKVIVSAIKTEMTNGRKYENTIFNEENWKYSETNQELVITVKNEENNGYIWNGKGTDEYLVTYIYGETALNKQQEENEIQSNIEVKVKAFSNTGIIETTKEIKETTHLSEEIGSAVTNMPVSITANISKGNLYANTNSDKNLYETEYRIKDILNITNTTKIEEIETKIEQETFVDENGNEYPLATEDQNYTLVKAIYISTNNFKEMLGENGQIQILNKNGEEIAKITKETTEAYGDFVVKFDEPVEDITIKTSTPEKAGEIYINYVKAIKANSPYTREEIKTFKELVIKTQTSYNEGNTTNASTAINLEETTSKITATIDKTTFTNNQEEVEIKLELNNNNINSDLYQDTEIEVMLPTFVTGINSAKVDVLYENELEPTNLQIQGNTVRFELSGTQSEFNTVQMANGSTILLNMNVEIEKREEKREETLTIEYANKIATQYPNGEEKGKIELTTQVTAKKEEIIANAFKGLLGDPLENIGVDINDISVKLEAYVDGVKVNDFNTLKKGQIITYKVIVKNEGDVDVTNITVRAPIPTPGVAIQHELIDGYESSYKYIIEEGTIAKEITIGKLEAGSTANFEYMVLLKTAPTIEEFYADNPEFRVENIAIFEDIDLTPEQEALLEERDQIQIQMIKDGATEEEIQQAMDDFEAQHGQIITTEVVGLEKEYYINDTKLDLDKEPSLNNKVELNAGGIVTTIYSNTHNAVIRDTKADFKIVTTKIEEEETNEAYAGDTILYTMFVNSNEGDLTNLKIEDLVPEGTTLLEVKINDVEVQVQNNSISLPNITEGTGIEIELRVTVNELPEGEYEKEIISNAKLKINNVLEANIYTYEDAPTVIVKPELITLGNQTEIDETLNSNEQITYKVQMKNNGRTSMNLLVEDFIPEGMQVVNCKYTIGVITENLDIKYNSLYEEILLEAGKELNLEITVSIIDIPAYIVSKQFQNTLSISASRMEKKELTWNTNILNANYDPKAPLPGDEPDNPTNPWEPTEDNKYRITGTVWLDGNRDSAKDDTEETMPNIKAKLLNSNTNQIIAETTTNIQGQYIFNNLEQGNYIVVFEYNEDEYELTEYKKANVANSKNSKAIKSTNKNEAVTDAITITNSYIDYINMGLIKRQKFAITLEKYISKVVVQNGEGTKEHKYGDTNLAKIDINGKYVNGTTLLVEYKLVIKNTGDVKGKVEKITDYTPAGMEFISNLNPTWIQSQDRNLHNTELKNIEINPGETKQLTLTLSKKLTEENIGIINNMAEITTLSNELGIAPTYTPGNKDTKEPDLGSVDLIVSLKTGEAIIYTILILTSIIILSTGIYEINKKVLK